MIFHDSSRPVLRTQESNLSPNRPSETDAFACACHKFGSPLGLGSVPSFCLAPFTVVASSDGGASVGWHGQDRPASRSAAAGPKCEGENHCSFAGEAAEPWGKPIWGLLT